MKPDTAPSNQSLVIITGASTGIGRETAQHLARKGHQVIGCVRKPEDGNALLLADCDNLQYFILDVTDAGHHVALQQYLDRQLPALDGLASVSLVNNAGISTVAPIETLQADDLEATFETNVFGLVRTIQTLLPYIKAHPGRIVNISSGAGVMAIPLSGAYSMSKYSVEALSDVLRVELKQFGIAVSVVEPGLVVSPIHGKATASMEAQIASFDPAQRAAYERPLRTYVENQQKASHSATPAFEVARIIARALEDRRPKARYGAGKDARLLNAIHWLLHARTRDFLTSQIGKW